MKSFIILVLLSAFIISSLGASISYSKNVSLTVNNQDFDYRSTSLDTWSILNFNGAFFSSVSVGHTQHSTEGDAVWGAAYINVGSIPLVWLAYWNTTVSYDSNTNFNELDVTSSSGYIANSYIFLTEKNPSGAVVKVQSLAQEIVKLGSYFDWDIGGAQSNGGLKWATFTGGPTGQSWKINLTFVVSDVIGVIDYAQAIVSPKSLESIVQITNYPYQNAGNTLSLTIGIATGSANAQGSIIVSGSSQNKVSFAVSNTAIVDGSTRSISVSSFSSGDFDTDFGDSNLKAQLDDKYSGNAEIKLVTVTFPAGANNIIYDPTVTAGETISEYIERSAASFTTFSMILAAASILSLLVV